MPGPRRLALLAIVAAAGTRGITRDKVLGILWPDKDEEQARHTLSQTLYLLRREADAPCVTGSVQLRLDTSIASDVVQFQEAMSAGHLARAVELCTGPFLDGIYLAGAPEFESWVEETRARLQSALRKALETLARHAVEAKAFSEAADWWRRLLELDPFNATYAAARIRALKDGGDHAGALSFAREYEARVRHELDAEPDPVIGKLIAQLRTLPDATSPPALSEQRNSHQTTRIPSDATPAPGPSTQPFDRAPASRRRRRFWLPAAGALVLAVAAAAWRVGSSGRIADESVPFLAIGAIQSRDSASLGPVLRDMLATSLGRLSGIRIVSSSRLLELLPSPDSETPAATKDAARRAGANEVIEGELRAGPGGLVLTLRRVAIRSGEVVQGHTMRAADVFALTDSATNAISADFGVDPPPSAIATVKTRSSVAYALYDQGLRAFYAGNYPAAAQLMYAALGRDSTFAMAAAYAWRTSVTLSRFEEARRDLPTVKRLASRAPERERLLIETLVANYGGAALTELLDAARRLTERYPDEPDGHVLLGRALYEAGEWGSAIASFNRAVAVDSAAGANSAVFCRVCEALAGVRDSYLWSDSAAAAERAVRRLIALRPRDGFGWGLLVEPLLRQGRRAEAEAANANAGRLGSPMLDFPAANRDLIRAGRLDELEQRVLAEVRTSPPELIGELPWMLAFVLRNQGRLREARELTANGVVPGTSRQLRGYYDPSTLAIVALESGEHREAARRFLDMVKDDRARNDGRGFVARGVSWHMTLAATAYAAAGDTAQVRALADSVRRIGPHSSIGRDVRLPHFLDGLLLQRERRHAEAVEAFRRAVLSFTDGYTRINLELARSLVALKRYAEAIAVLQPALRGGVDGSNSYLTHTELHEALAETFYAAGQRDSAAVHYAAVERAWRKADPQFAQRYATARARATAD